MAVSSLKDFGKRLLYPGLDLHTRCRYRFLPDLLAEGPLETLDAGFGNGALAYAAYRKGNRVTGVSFSSREVTDTLRFFGRLGIPSDRIDLRQMNIYDLRTLDRRFDQIICSETLEHIKRDREVVEMFADLLLPGGALLLCCPHSLHPEHNLGRTDEPETGYHVRDGYTIDTYRDLLEGTGLRVAATLGLGSPLICRLDKILRGARGRVGDLGCLPLFLLFAPLTRLDRIDPKMPFSLAVLARKEGLVGDRSKMTADSLQS